MNYREEFLARQMANKIADELNIDIHPENATRVHILRRILKLTGDITKTKEPEAGQMNYFITIDSTGILFKNPEGNDLFLPHDFYLKYREDYDAEMQSLARTYDKWLEYMKKRHQLEGYSYVTMNVGINSLSEEEKQLQKFVDTIEYLASQKLDHELLSKIDPERILKVLKERKG